MPYVQVQLCCRLSFVLLATCAVLARSSSPASHYIFVADDVFGSICSSMRNPFLTIRYSCTCSQTCNQLSLVCSGMDAIVSRIYLLASQASEVRKATCPQAQTCKCMTALFYCYHRNYPISCPAIYKQPSNNNLSFLDLYSRAIKVQ
jgi:hypothetical protein